MTHSKLSNIVLLDETNAQAEAAIQLKTAKTLSNNTNHLAGTELDKIFRVYAVPHVQNTKG